MWLRQQDPGKSILRFTLVHVTCTLSVLAATLTYLEPQWIDRVPISNLNLNGRGLLIWVSAEVPVLLVWAASAEGVRIGWKLLRVDDPCAVLVLGDDWQDQTEDVDKAWEKE